MVAAETSEKAAAKVPAVKASVVEEGGSKVSVTEVELMAAVM